VTAAILFFVLTLDPPGGQARQNDNLTTAPAVAYSAMCSRHPVSIPRETLSGRLEAENGFVWRYGYDIGFNGKNLVVQVKVNLVPAGGVTVPMLRQVTPVWEEGIEGIWGHRFVLETPSGRRYPIVIDVSFRGPSFHHDVIVRPGAGGTDALNWNIQDSPELVAHEFGHLIGQFDEYVKGAQAPNAAMVDPESIMASNPGVNAKSRARHFDPFRKWFVGKTKTDNVRIIHEKGIRE